MFTLHKDIHRPSWRKKASEYVATAIKSYLINNLQWKKEIETLNSKLDTNEDEAPALHGIMAEETDKFRTMEFGLSNLEFQRQGLEAHCAKLGVENPQMPVFRGMRKSLTSRFWQPLTVPALLDFEDSIFRGGVLADEVGTGKITKVLSLLLYVRTGNGLWSSLAGLWHRSFL